MKKLTMIMLLMAFIAFASQAQPGQRRPGKTMSIEDRVEKARTDLDLSDEQVEQWTEVLKKYDEEMQTARKDRDREQVMAIREKMGSELQAILDGEQSEKFEAMRENRKKSRRPNGK